MFQARHGNNEMIRRLDEMVDHPSKIDCVHSLHGMNVPKIDEFIWS